MDNKFLEHLDMFITERSELSVSNLRKTNIEYNNLRIEHTEESLKFDTIINNLPYKDKEFIEHYIDDIYFIEDKEKTSIYIQGFKDCIKILSIFRISI